MIYNLLSFRRYLSHLHRLIIPKREIYLHEEDGIYFLTRYVPIRKFNEISLSKRNFIKCMWKYKNGDVSAFQKMTEWYLRLVEELIASKKLTGRILITSIPKSDGSLNPLAKSVFYICTIAKVDGCFIKEGVDSIRRIKMLSPIHKGNHYSVEDLKESMSIRRDDVCETVIILDDVVKSGNTFKAVSEMFRELGAREVYCVSLFKV